MSSHDRAAALGLTLRALRQRARLTQRDLAIALDVTPSMVHRWERHGATPSTPHLVRLAAVLGVTVDDLLGQLAPKTTDVVPAGDAPPTLRALREAAGLSQWQLSVRLGVTEGAVSRWEAGTRLPQPRYLAPLAQLLGGLSTETLLASLMLPADEDAGPAQTRCRAGAASARAAEARSAALWEPQQQRASSS